MPEKQLLDLVRQQLTEARAMLAGVTLNEHSFTVSLSYETVRDIVQVRAKLDFLLDTLSPVLQEA